MGVHVPVVQRVSLAFYQIHITFTTHVAALRHNRELENNH